MLGCWQLVPGEELRLSSVPSLHLTGVYSSQLYSLFEAHSAPASLLLLQVAA